MAHNDLEVEVTLTEGRHAQSSKVTLQRLGDMLLFLLCSQVHVCDM